MVPHMRIDIGKVDMLTTELSLLVNFIVTRVIYDIKLRKAQMNLCISGDIHCIVSFLFPFFN